MKLFVALSLSDAVFIMLINVKMPKTAEMPTIPFFLGFIPIFKANFRITILNVKKTANNNIKMVPDKIMGNSYLYIGYT